MKSHIKVLALAVALSPAAAFAQAPSTPAGSTPPTFPSGQQTTGGDHDRDNQTQQLPRMGDADDQARQDRDRDRDRDGQYGSVNQATASNVQSVIQQRLPNSNIAVNVANGNSLVLTGAVPSDRERVYVEQLARQQAPNVNIINQITTANAQGSGGYGTGGAVGSATVPSTTGTYGSSSGAIGSGDRDRDRDRQSGVATQDNDRDRQSGGADADRDRDRDRDQSSATSGDRDRDRDNMSAQSDQDKDKDRDHKDNGKHKGQHKKDKDKDKKDHDKKDKDERDRDQQQSPQSPR